MSERSLRERQKREKDFWDEKIARKYENSTTDYKLENTLNYQELFARMPRFQPVLEYVGDIEGLKVLELGCGNGWVSLYFGRSGAEVVACDISATSIEVARRWVAANGLSDNVRPAVMSSEELAFEDETFDVVFMNDSIHHCDPYPTAREIARVLKKGGKVAITDDGDGHPMMNLYRALTPGRRTRDERPLTLKEWDDFLSHFSNATIKRSRLLRFLDFDGPLGGFLEKVDHKLLGLFPSLGRFGRHICVCATK